MIVDISIGHGPDPGWQGSRSRCGLSEYEYAHTYLRPALEKVLADSLYTPRFWDAGDHRDWRRERRSNLLLLDRMRSIYSAQPAPRIALDLHCNASRNARYGGYMAIYRREKDGVEHAPSKLFASLLCGKLQQALSIRNLGAQGDQGDWVERDLAWCRVAKKRGVVGVILELGFLTCPVDVEILRAKETPGKVARAIRATLEAFGRQ